MKLSVVIPARNEAGNIGRTLDKLTACLRQAQAEYEIVVVDDGSTDATTEEVEARAARDPGVRLIHNTGLHGFGRAIRAGLDAYTGDAVVIAMADDSDDPQDVLAYYDILRDKAECAFGSRWMRGGSVEDYPLFKRILNRLANTFVRILFRLPYDDVTNAFKGYRRNVIDGCRPFLSPHFNLTVEIPLKAIVRGYSYAVTPIRWYNRKHGQSNLHVEEMSPRYLYIVLIVWLERQLTMDDYRRRDALVGVPAPEAVPHEQREALLEKPAE